MRLGRVALTFGYVVDLDDPRMVERAKNCTIEDAIECIVKSEDAEAYITVTEDATLSESDIPEFLLDTDLYFDQEDK